MLFVLCSNKKYHCGVTVSAPLPPPESVTPLHGVRRWYTSRPQRAAKGRSSACARKLSSAAEEARLRKSKVHRIPHPLRAPKPSVDRILPSPCLVAGCRVCVKSDDSRRNSRKRHFAHLISPPAGRRIVQDVSGCMVEDGDRPVGGFICQWKAGSLGEVEHKVAWSLPLALLALPSMPLDGPGNMRRIESRMTS